MQVKQIYTFVNTATQEALGETAVVNEDLSNIIEIGNSVFNANAVDNYVRALVNCIGRTIFVDRSYKGRAPEILMDGWEYGSVLRKIRCDLPEASENEDWELTSGSSYDPNIFTPPVIHEKFFNKAVTYQIPMSITEEQVRESFQSVEQLNAFVSMIFTQVDNSLTVKSDALIMRAINNMIGATLYDEYQNTGYSTKSGVRAVNLLKLYNTAYGLTGTDALVKSDALYDADFIKFAVYYINKYKSYLSVMSKKFNIGNTHKFTPDDKLHCVLLDDFASATKVFLTSDTFNKEFVALPQHSTVPYWQGTGTDFSLSSLSKVDVEDSNNHTTSCDYIIGVMFDHDSCGVMNPTRRTTSGYNPKGDFYNYWFKAKSEYINDFDENFVVFFLA